MTAICTTYRQKPVAIPLILLSLTLDLIVKEDIQQLQPPVAGCLLQFVRGKTWKPADVNML